MEGGVRDEVPPEPAHRRDPYSILYVHWSDEDSRHISDSLPIVEGHNGPQ